MTYDILTRVSNEQSITGTTSVVSTNSYDLSTGIGPGGTPVVRDVGAGEPMRFMVHVTTGLTAGQTLIVEIILATDSALTTSITPIGQSVALSTTLLTTGARFDVPVPTLTQALLAANGKRFIGLRYLPSSSLAAGAVSAWIPVGGTSTSPPRRYVGNYVGP